MNGEQFFYVGCYTEQLLNVSGRGEGIYLGRLDLESGEMAELACTPGLVNPSYMAVDAHGQADGWRLFAVQECFADRRPAVHAFSIDPHNARLRYLNTRAVPGELPCHIGVQAGGKWVVVSNYWTGNVVLYPVLGDSGLGPASHTVQHQGHSINLERQAGPHAHAAVFGPADDPEDAPVLVTDLGLDKVMIYRLDAGSEKLLPASPAYARVSAGAGPRHLVFHPQGRHAFLINELHSTITVLAYEQGVLRPLQSLSTLPAGYSGPSYAAAVQVAPSGRFVYASNRGHDSIAVFAFSEAKDPLEQVQHLSSGGRTPRDFVLDPSGQFLLAANQESDSIVSFQVDRENGRLNPTGHSLSLGTPVCLKMLPKMRVPESANPP